MHLNNYEIAGHLGRDPEVKFTSSGKALATFSVASTERFGENEYTTWHNVKAWGALAEWVGNNLHKGDNVFVKGKFNVNKYTAKDGTPKQFPELVAGFVSTNFATAERITAAKKKELGPWDDDSPVVPSDDIPF